MFMVVNQKVWGGNALSQVAKSVTPPKKLSKSSALTTKKVLNLIELIVVIAITF